MTSTSPASLATALREQIDRRDVAIAPGVYDVVSARLVEEAGFDVAYMTGSGVSISATGYPDNGLISFGEVTSKLEQIAANLTIPLIADGDTGFGNAVNVVRTVRTYEKYGASGIQLEDQVMPKKCGHEPGRRCISGAEMRSKIQAAVDARESDDFLVIARTDARSVEGLGGALERAAGYVDAGADMIFVEALESKDEIRNAARSVDAPLMVNMVEGGRTPLCGSHELTEMGVALAIYPNTVLRTVCRQVQDVMSELRRTGTSLGLLDRMADHDTVWELFGRRHWDDLAKKYGDSEFAGSTDSTEIRREN